MREAPASYCPDRLSSSLVVQFGPHAYPYTYGRGTLAGLAGTAELFEIDKYFIVEDLGVPSVLREQVWSSLFQLAPAVRLPYSASENSKSLGSIERLATLCFQNSVSRASCIVAVGGGTTGNVAGLLCSLLFRGLRLIHIPTTLLAALDSVLSLKQAVNFGSTKNALGAFLVPSLVLTDYEFFDSLTDAQVKEGLSECLKNSLAIAPSTLDSTLALAERCGSLRDEDYACLLEAAVTAKTQVIGNDPLERGEGLALEYGHTFGHAIELLSRGRVTHGRGVAIGMVYAAEVAHALGYLSQKDRAVHRSAVARLGLKPIGQPDFSAETVLFHMLRDNKRGYLPASDSEFPMILLRSLGIPVRSGTLPLKRVPREVAKSAAQALLRDRSVF